MIIVDQKKETVLLERTKTKKSGLSIWLVPSLVPPILGMDLWTLTKGQPDVYVYVYVYVCVYVFVYVDVYACNVL